MPDEANGTVATNGTAVSTHPAPVTPVAPAGHGGRQDEATPEGGESTGGGVEGEAATEPTTAFAVPAFDQSYAWMMQLVILVTAMTFFFPFLRNMFGLKSKKRHVANYTYDSDEDECEENYDENLEEYCEEE